MNRRILPDLQPEDSISIAQFENGIVLLAAVREVDATKIFWWTPDQECARPLCELPAAFEWLSPCFYAPSSLLVSSAQNGSRWRLLFVRIVPIPAEKERKERAEPGVLKLKCKFDHVDISLEYVPKQLLPISSDEVLILDESGQLHYLNTKRNVPVKLTTWHIDEVERLFAGSMSWIARASRDHLSMWKINRGGYLTPYEARSFSISGIDPKTMLTSSDGRYLFAYNGRLVATWKFPRFVTDTIYEGG